MSDRFRQEKEQILTQYILHHDVADHDVAVLADRLDKAVALADRLHKGQKRRSGEEYIVHPLRTTMEVSRFGKIVDWPSIEAALLHDTIEDTDYSYSDICRDFPDAAGLVEALTKIKDSRELTYQKLFRYVLQDIRVLLIKIADRLDNLESLHVFSREKQLRIASESAAMYANICRRLCMLDLAERLAEKVGQYLVPEQAEQYRQAQARAKEEMSRPLDQLRQKLANIFPGDLTARIEVRWNRFDPEGPRRLSNEDLFTVYVITGTFDEAYQALGRIHQAFNAIPKAFADNISNPRTNGFRALETMVAHRSGIVRFYITSRQADKFNRLGLLSMDIESPQFNLQYLDDLREFLQTDEGNLQDFIKFQIPDAIQVVSPNGDIYSLEEGTTALDFAFAVHNELGLRATGAKVNDLEAPLDMALASGDRIEIETAPEPVCDERYLGWAHSRKALTAIRRYLRKHEEQQAAGTGRQWLIESAAEVGISADEAVKNARRLAAERGTELENLYRSICLGELEIKSVLADARQARQGHVEALVKKLRPGKSGGERKVRRYEFEEPHIRFCPHCAPVSGDEIFGCPEAGRLIVHRKGCLVAGSGSKVPLMWDRDKKVDLRDPGPVEMELHMEATPGAFYAVVGPFRNLGLDIDTINMPGEDGILRLEFTPGTSRTMDKLIRALRRVSTIHSIRVMRDVQSESFDASPDGSSMYTIRPSGVTE